MKKRIFWSIVATAIGALLILGVCFIVLAHSEAMHWRLLRSELILIILLTLLVCCAFVLVAAWLITRRLFDTGDKPIYNKNRKADFHSSGIDRIKQEFTANVSHELKTPLTSISGYAEIIESGMASDNDAVVFAGRIRRESQRMLSLISDILKLSKLDEKGDEDTYETVDLLKIANECCDLLEMNAGKNGVNVSVSGEKSYVLGNPNELTELVYNLIDNGIRYNRAGGSVAVEISASDGGENEPIAILTVRDTGIGISSEHQSRVFERFYRVDKSRSKETGGTGLGLAIVKHVAERHNAKIDLTSREGEGTTIRVAFYEFSEE